MRACLLFLLSLALAACAAEPLLVWNVDFNANPTGAPPAGATKERLEQVARDGAWGSLPIRTYSKLEYVTDTRLASTPASANGLRDKPLLFVCSEGAHSQYGPRLWFELPVEIAEKAAVWRLSLDVAKGEPGISGGLQLWDAAEVTFFEDGTLCMNNVELARHAVNQPLHLEFLVDNQAKTVRATVDGKTAAALTLPWRAPRVPFFRCLVLDGILPGGHGQAPSSVAFDNIKLYLEKRE